MPPLSPAPFLVVKKKDQSFFSLDTTPQYSWSTQAGGVEQDTSLHLYRLLLKNWRQNAGFVQLASKVPIVPKRIKKDSKTAPSLPRGTFTHKIFLEDFDDLNISHWPDLAFAFGTILSDIVRYIRLGEPVSINFREVFLVSKGEQPPAQYRPNVDILVHSAADYSKATNRLSYQLGKYLLNEFKFNLPKAKSNSFIWSDYKTPLKDYNYFDSALMGYLSLYYQRNYHSTEHPVIAFSNPVAIDELLPFFQHLTANRSHELILILKGPQYEDEQERQRAYEELVQVIAKSKCNFIVHIFLITKENLNCNLLDLKPKSPEKTDGLHPLAHDAGYYFSSTKAMSSIYRAIQSHNQVNDTWLNRLQQRTTKIKTLGAYIRAQEVSKNVRRSKTLTREQLKSKVQLSITHQQSIAQQEELSQTQTVNEQVQEQLELDVNQQQNFTFERELNWDFKITLDGFCKKLEAFAKKNLPKIAEHEQVLEQAGYLTQFYLKKYSKLHFYQQLANDSTFRLRVAARFFGHALIADENDKDKLIKVRLPHYPIDAMEEFIADDLINGVHLFLDGLPAKECIIKDSFFYGRTLCGLNRNHTAVRFFNPPQIFSKLSYQSQLQTDKRTNNVESSGFQDPLIYSVLLPEELLSTVDIDLQHELVQKAEQLLNLFKPHPPLNEKEILTLESHFLSLVRFFFPNNIADITHLEQFISQFPEHNEDNLKILLHLVISKHKNGLDAFFQLLSFLNAYSLSDYFYKIHFQYALNVSSVNRILHTYTSNPLLKLASKIPEGKPLNEWPDFELFALHFLVFTAKNGLALDYNELALLERFWQRVYAKFLLYSGNQEAETQKLMHQLTQQLIHHDGLSIAPISELKTFYEGLEALLDHAIAQNSLKEQIDEIRDISLVYTDAPYAWEWNGFNVLSAEMQIYSAAINPLTKSYAISHKELEQAMIAHKVGDKPLKTMLFRFLGTQSLRENLAFYRHLHQTTTQTNDEISAYISELLCAYHALTYTGNGYGSNITQEVFKENFNRFLSKHHLNNGLSDIQLSAGITRFFIHLNEQSTDEHKGIQSLWSIWRTHQVDAFKISNTPIPSVFLRKFDAKKLGNFLFSQRENLEKALPELNNNPKSIRAIINQWVEEFNIPATHKKIVFAYLKKLYPGFNLAILLRNLPQINNFLESITSISHNNPKSFIYLTLDILIEKNTNTDALLCFTQLFAEELSKHQNHAITDKKASSLLLALAKKSHIYCCLPEKKPLIRVLLESFFNTDNVDSPLFLVDLAEKLLPLSTNEAEKVFTTLSQMAKNNDGLAFLNTHTYLSMVQLKELSLFFTKVKSHSLAINLMQDLFKQDMAYDLSILNAILKDKPSEEVECLLKLAHSICQYTEEPLVNELRKLMNKPLPELKKLVQLHQVQFISASEILTLLDTPSLNEAIAHLKRQKSEENRQRFEYNPQFVKEKIAGIKLKSHETNENLPLSQEEQDRLWADYQLLMSYMVEKPFKFESSGIIKECTIHDLDEADFPILFKTLQERIAKGEDRHHNQLLLIALSAEALYQSTKKFPRCTQILTLLKRLRYSENLIHELKTGEGKSIVGAMHGAWLCGLGHTVDIATENDELARNALEKFGPFYQYLGIAHGKDILAAQSIHSEYIVNGINYSTASNIALFRARMALEKKPLPKNPALVCDEIDAILTSTIQFRLAATLDPLLNDTKKWTQIYQIVLEFVKENELFINNPCSDQEDILNLKNYFIAKNPDKEFLEFTNKISDELLNILIESSMVAHELEEKVDYYVVETIGTSEKRYYAAPIIASTKRPDPKVSYSEYVQQLLHTLLNNKKPPPAHPFVVEPCTETLLAISAKNFFDYYRLNDGPIVGLTGTSGARVELVEFYEEQGLVAFKYPTFYPDLAEDLGLVTAFGPEDHQKKIHEWIEAYKRENPSQPILLITPSPQATENIWGYLKTRTQWSLQCFHGYAETGKSEENVIYTAGKEDFLTLANQSLARGADIDPEHEQGLLVINTCTDLTASELEQIEGRAARNGKAGRYASVIDAQKIGSPTDSAQALAEAFQAHQHQISLAQQQERSKMRLLEDARYFMINEYILKLRETADKILMRQYGEGASITEQQNFLKTLNILNQNAEKHYEQLLKTHKLLDSNAAHEFLTARIGDQNNVLNKWIPQDRFNSIQFIEPSIPLEVFTAAAPQLQGAPISQLSALASIFSRKWSVDGHQKTMHHIHALEEVCELFDPYLKKKCSFKQALGQALERKGTLQREFIDDQIHVIKSTINELISYAQTIPLIGYLVPAERIKTFFANYLDTTKKQILEKKWDEINLPIIDFSGVNTWFSGISTALTISSVLMGGPIPYIIKSFIIPTIFGWIKNKLKSSFADSESLVAQILIGLDDIGNDLSKMIKALTEITNETEIKIGWFLDNFGPLAKNKALVLALSKYLELLGKKELCPLVSVIPEVLNLLESYREQQPDALLNVDALMVFLSYAARSEPILNALNNTPYKTSLQRASQLNPNFLNQISNLSFAEFLNLLKVIAHPNFFVLLEKLPPDTSYEQLCQWLEKIPEDLPIDCQHALKEFLNYQQDPERVAEESKQDLQNLRTKFNLTMERFTEGLERLKPKLLVKPEEPTPIPEPPVLQVDQPQKSFWGMQQIIMCSAALVILACSVVYLSISLALTGVFLMGWMAYPYLEQQISSYLSSRQNIASQEPSGSLTPLALLNHSPAKAVNTSPEKNKASTMQEKLPKLIDSKDLFFTPALPESPSTKNQNVERSRIIAGL
ncbi:preprotein translocase subunit SecA [Legionella saoudiensis]|uniref:preprotein translocase subunit SecA n=1 Tax=Legionella saoudiensis TaxID=1750561 RepID=UPI000731D029|nr:preprotein translocase subunit SecA [Legionella saoudiensis]